MKPITINDLAQVKELDRQDLAQVAGGSAPKLKGVSSELQNQPFTPHAIQDPQPSIFEPWAPPQLEDCCN